MKNITEALNWRYTTKVFDESKKISEADFAHIENILQLSPTSTNLQPSYFIVADDNAGRARIAKGTQGAFSFNAPKIMAASHVIVFCSKVYADDTHLKLVLEKENADGRYASEEIKAQMAAGRQMFLNMHRYQLKDEANWHAKQTYITMGAVLLAAAQLGIDATPMEGIDLPALDAEFNLNSKNYTALAVISLGYRKEGEDFNANLPKSRLAKSSIINKA